MKKTITYSIISVLLVFILSATLFLLKTPDFLSAFSDNTVTRKKIIIDAGHGGFDAGASAEDGTSEKNINLSIAMKLRDLLNHFGFETVMTREQDVSTESNGESKNKKTSDLRNRLNVMKKNPDAIFVSIHLNKYTTSQANGAQVFYSHKNETSDLMAQSIQNSICKLLQPDNTRAIKKGQKNIFLLHNATVPAIIVECGFLSNPTDLQNLKDVNYQSKIAFSIFCGIIDYYNELR